MQVNIKKDADCYKPNEIFRSVEGKQWNPNLNALKCPIFARTAWRCGLHFAEGTLVINFMGRTYVIQLKLLLEVAFFGSNLVDNFVLLEKMMIV